MTRRRATQRLRLTLQELLGYPLRHGGNMMALFGDGPYRGSSSYAYNGAPRCHLSWRTRSYFMPFI